MSAIVIQFDTTDSIISLIEDSKETNASSEILNYSVNVLSSSDSIKLFLILSDASVLHSFQDSEGNTSFYSNWMFLELLSLFLD